MTTFATVEAVHDYTATTDTELSFKKGQIITIYDFVDDHWWEGSVGGKHGFVPASYVKHELAAPVSDPPSAATSVHASATGSAASSAVPSGPGSRQPSSEAIGTQYAAYQTPMAERPNLSKAVMMHHTRAKHEVGSSHQAGLLEFKRKATQIKSGTAKPKAEATELQSVLNRRSVMTEQSLAKEQADSGMSELQKRFSQRKGATLE
eukprot:m.192417 g.192417  ORF g.192417 m.192417 type:complete len:206 (+) comp14854_c1_seq1:2946-3563(+)